MIVQSSVHYVILEILEFKCQHHDYSLFLIIIAAAEIGYTYFQQRRGILSRFTDLGDQIMQDEIDQHLLKAIEKAKNYGMSVESLLERIKTLSKQSGGDAHE